MPKLIINIPDTVFNRIKDSFDNNGSSTDTQKEQLFQEAISSFILKRVTAFESRRAAEIAAQQSEDNIKRDIVLQTEIRAT